MAKVWLGNVASSVRPSAVRGCVLTALLACTTSLCFIPAGACGQATQSNRHGAAARVHGRVVDSDDKPVSDALVTIDANDSLGHRTVTTDAAGLFSFDEVMAGKHRLAAKTIGNATQELTIVVSSQQTDVIADFVLRGVGVAAASDGMQFADEPKFTVAGVMDWTAVGGHGSDATLRTSEDLARATLTLKPDRSGSGAGNAGAEAHRLSGERDEASGDSLAAVREFEQAVRLDPSEENYFAWGSELLLHRAVWQARDVFARGAEAHPDSERLKTSLGAALFAGALYGQAAEQLCAASDMNPSDAGPYEFMGKVELAAPSSLDCIEQRLKRFHDLEPTNSMANYLHAMALLKRQGASDSAQIEELLKAAVALDSKCADGYLQLGILASSRHESDRAIEYYKRAVASNPQLADAHYRLAMAYDRAGDGVSAKRELELHERIEKLEAAKVEEQRREIKQFLVVSPEQTKAVPQSR